MEVFYSRDRGDEGVLRKYIKAKHAWKQPALVLMILFLSATPADAQRVRGELRIEVRDPQDAAVAPSAELASDVNEFHREFQVAADGRYVAQDLPFGVYRLRLKAVGFANWAGRVEIPSEVPVHLSVRLGVAPVATQVDVTDADTLLDANRTGTQYSIGHRALSEYIAPQPGRELSDLVSALPGWLYESNGVLHPRGSEYDVQYVVDGLPLTENRSPAFAPSFDAENVESMRVLTANYPAEYGRKLGGVVEVTTGKDAPLGLHGQFDAGGGNFSTASGAAGISYARARNRVAMSGHGFHTDRYLDPPVVANFTNRGDAGGFSASYERDFSDRDRLRATITHNVTRFLVPNHFMQQNAGQRQDIVNRETSGQLYFQHTISPNLFLSLSGSVREAVATLASNSLSTPVIASQDRGYRQGYARGDLAGHAGHHNWKLGLDGILTSVREKLRYAITDATQFDEGTRQNFNFLEHRWDVEPSTYVQDQIHFGNWNMSAGLRFDHYRLIVRESAWSPRIGVSRYVPRLNLLVHAAYDRVFQTPAVENLLLASSPQLDAINPIVVRLPVRPARANFYEVGVTKSFWGRLRLDANVFRRDFRNYSDDDVLLDTGVSFPIAFAKGRIAGEELRLEIARWGRFSGYLSYANQSGIGQGPVTGGLFLGSDAGSQLAATSQFAVTQDQRNTARARVRYEAPHHVWLAAGAEFGSGLPTHFADADPSLLLERYGAAILDRVNLERGRVRPVFSCDAAAGVEAYRQEHRIVALQIQAMNLSNRVNVINFAGLFSGTAIAPPRSVSARLRFTF